MYVQPFDGSLAPGPLSAPAGMLEGDGPFPGGAAPAAGDNISRFVPPWLDESAAGQYGAGAYGGSPQGLFAPLIGMLAQLMQMLQSLIGYRGCGGSSGGGGQPYGRERYFQNATGSSDGDPHLSFNGARWNDMASQPDLLNSNSFPGGFRVSTQATPPNTKGVTWNQSATVAMNNGATTVNLNDRGQASIECNGQSLSIARGQTLQLGDGASVECEQNGSLCITSDNGAGGRIVTTLRAQGNGVDVGVTAHDVDLGGSLANGVTPVTFPDT